MSIHNMLCYSKLEHLYYRVYPALKNFPVSEKYSLCVHIKDCFLGALKSMSLGNSVKSKRKQYLQEAEAELQHLGVLVRFSRNQKYISKGFFEDIDTALSEVKALLSGWLKQTIGSSSNKSESKNEVNHGITDSLT